MMIQDISPARFDNRFQTPAPQAEDCVLLYTKGGVLAAQTDGLRLPTVGALPPLPLRYAFSIDAQRFFLADDAPPVAPFADFSYVPSGVCRLAAPRTVAFACAVGESLHRWYAGTRFCGCCGAPMQDSETERARVCPRCGNTVYPKICPAVIVAITDGERLLLTKYAGRAFTRYALVAGFCEIGETVEQTVRREVYEETGLSVSALRFYKSQPWVYTDSLLCGFYAKLEGSDAPQLLDGELREATWFTRAEIPEDFSPISLTGEMITRFRDGFAPFSDAPAPNGGDCKSSRCM